VKIAYSCVLTCMLAAVVSASSVPIKTNGRSSYGFNPTGKVGCLSPSAPIPSLANCSTDPITEFAAPASSVSGDEEFMFSVTSPTLADFTFSIVFPGGVDTTFIGQPVGDFTPETGGTAGNCDPTHAKNLAPCDTTHPTGPSALDTVSISGDTVTFDIQGGDGPGLALYVVAVSTVPEPSSAALLSLGFLGLVTLGRVHKNLNSYSALKSLRKH
jgi:hypothetical protein